MKKPLTILLVEDNDDDAVLVERALEKQGLAVEIKRVDSSSEFESAISSTQFDAILADFSLPQFSGIEALRLARAKSLDVPFIIVSGTIGEQTAVEAMRGGAHDYVMKQSLGRLGAALERELAEAELRRAHLRSEQEIHEREEWFRALIENASDLVAVLEPDGVIRYQAPSSERLLGFPPEEMVGTNALERIHPEDLQRVGRAFRDAVSSGRSMLRLEYRYRHADGTWLHIESVGRNLRDHPAVRGIVVNSRDITERKLVESQLAQAQRLASLGHLAATVAHEFNNVLMGIQPYAEIVRRRAADIPQLAKAAESISSSIMRGRRITQEILRFTQPANLTCVPLDLQQWLERVRPELESLLGATHRLEIHVAEGTAVQADPEHLLQTIVNIVLNARDAMMQPGVVTIAAQKTADDDSSARALLDSTDFISIEISDTGTGMNAETLKHVFDPLFTTKKSGTGLGLAVTRQIIERHGGRIFADSTLGEGTVFHIFLPVAKSAEVHVQSPAPEKREMQVARILLVEDDAAISSGLSTLLELDGFAMRVVATGGESFDAITDFEPDALVLDVGLPDIDGIELYQEIHRRWPRLPVIFSTGHGDRGRLESQLSGNDVRLILKPYDSADLVDLLQTILPQRAV